MRNLILFLALGLSSFSYALRTAYLNVEHPEGWRCELVQGVWICQSANDEDRRESVILSIATLATEWDTIDNYLGYLKAPRPIQDTDGKEVMSQVSYARKRNIAGTTWVDSLQHNSELAGFWTRYLATVHSTPKANLAILVTYIVSDENYEKMAPVFERMVSTLKPNNEFDLNIPSEQNDGPVPGSTRLGPDDKGLPDTKSLIAERLNIKRKETKKPAEGPDYMTWFLYVALALAGVALVLRKKRKAKAAAESTDKKAE